MPNIEFNEITFILLGIIISFIINLICMTLYNKKKNIESFNCKGVGKWIGNRGMDNWCEVNCNHTPSFCPRHPSS